MVEDGGNGKDKKEQPENKKPIVLTITLSPNNQLDVSAPGNGQVYDEALCDFLMKKASRYIEAHNNRANAPRIHTPPGRQSFGGAFGKRP